MKSLNRLVPALRVSAGARALPALELRKGHDLLQMISVDVGILPAEAERVAKSQPDRGHAGQLGNRKARDAPSTTPSGGTRGGWIWAPRVATSTACLGAGQPFGPAPTPAGKQKPTAAHRACRETADRPPADQPHRSKHAETQRTGAGGQSPALLLGGELSTHPSRPPGAPGRELAEREPRSAAAPARPRCA